MTIGSVLQSGIQGLQTAQLSMGRSAEVIAHASIKGNSSAPVAPNGVALAPTRTETFAAPETSNKNTYENLSTRQAESLEDALVNLQVQAYQAAGSARVVKTADQLLGTLINTRV